MIDYKLKLYRDNELISEDYVMSLFEGLFLMFSKLKNLNAVEFMSKGEFPETYNNFNNTYHHKRYVVYYEPLNTKFEICKVSPGDINQELVENIIKEILIIYERNNSNTNR